MRITDTDTAASEWGRHFHSLEQLAELNLVDTDIRLRLVELSGTATS